MKNPSASGAYTAADWTVYTIQNRQKIKSKTFNAR